jgi:hypothetical protein
MIRTPLVASTATGASTKELMSRMGHASPRAALIYQHATKDRDAVIASALSKIIVEGMRETRQEAGGSALAEDGGAKRTSA